MLDERTEILINRRLDGELSDAESLELDKLLIRNPQARAVLEEYARIDAAAGNLLRELASVPAAGAESFPVAASAPGRQWWQSFGLVAAVAAMVTLGVLLSHQASSLMGPPRTSLPPGPFTARTEPQLDYAWNVEGPRRETLNVERDVIGVWDRQSRSLYLLEADSTRSLVEPVKVNY